jgi:hypothetical protein
MDSALVIVTGAFMLLLIGSTLPNPGFGLFFSYLRNYNWSGMGFTLFITATVFQLYFLVNGFFTRANFEKQSNSSFTQTHISIFLNDEPYVSSATSTNEATAVGAIRCALALSIAFAGIGGRAGYLEAFLVSVLGTIGNVINSKLVSRFSVDTGSTMRVFLFGGTMGVIMALLLSCKQGKTFYAHPEYTSNKLSRTLSLVGGLFCWVFFPVFNMDVSPTLFLYSNGAISTFICISASVTTMVGLNLTFDRKIDFRSFLTSIIAGGVIIGSSSALIYNPLGGLFMGVLAAILQFLFVKLEVKMGMKPLWSNGVLFLFVVHGFIGSLASAVFRAINATSGSFGSMYNSLSSEFIKSQGHQIIGTFIAMGVGAATGLVVYLFIACVSRETRRTYYHDNGNWVLED